MRVLALTHSLGSNGAALCLCRLLIAIKSAGGSADVIYSGDEFLVQTLRENGVGVITQAQTGDYDVALVNTLLDAQRVVELAPALPVVFWVHEGMSLVHNGLSSAATWMQAFRLSSRLVFNTPWQYQTVFRSFLEGVDAHRISHVDPAVVLPLRPDGAGSGGDAGASEGGSVGGSAGGAGKAVRSIVTIGSVYPRKRPADLVEAVIRMADPELHCTFVGNLTWLQSNGPAMQESLARHADLFTLTGEVTDERKLQTMREATVFCSTSGDETFGIAAAEAALMGLPLALTDLPCYEGIWKHGVNALLAPVGAIDCQAWNLKALTGDHQLANRLASAARHTATRFSNDRFLRGMVEVLKDAIRDPARR